MPTTPPPITIAQWHALPAKHRPTTVTFTDQIISSHPFYRHSHLVSITLLNATHIGPNAFVACVKLHTLIAPLVTSVDERAFSGCAKLQTVVLPALATAGPNMFWGCTAIAAISLPHLTIVPEGMFAYCRNLRVADLPNVTRVSDWAFNECVKLQPPTFMATVEGINYSAFHNCQAFQGLDMQHLKFLGFAAFEACHNLHEIFMPGTFYANPYAFQACKAIRLIQTTASFKFNTAATPLIIRRRIGNVERNFWTRRTHRAATPHVANIAKTLALTFNRIENAPPPDLISEIISFLRRH
jgi:hypothetical protein